MMIAKEGLSAILFQLAFVPVASYYLFASGSPSSVGFLLVKVHQSL
jgi:hypothetical protein